MGKIRYIIILLFSLNIFPQEWEMLVEDDVVTVSIEGNITVGEIPIRPDHPYLDGPNTINSTWECK